MPFGSVLRELRLRNNMTQRVLAEALGLSESAIGMYERGHREPDFETLETIADYFNVDMDYLTGRSNIERKYPINNSPVIPAGLSPMPSTYKVPRLGRIPCGAPNIEDEVFETYDEVPDYIKADFTLECEGDSMIGARIYEGDIVCIRQQKTIQSGEIAAVRVDGDRITLKRVMLYDDHLILQPENPNHKPESFWEEDMNRVQIIGKATHFISLVR